MDAATRRLLRSNDLTRSITLLRAFLLASALILVAGGAVLGWTLSRTLWQQAVTSEQSSLARYVDGVVRPTLVHGDRVVVNRSGDRAMRDSFKAQGQDVIAVKVWQPNGRLAWTNLDRERIGHRFPLEGPLETRGQRQPRNGELRLDIERERGGRLRGGPRVPEPSPGVRTDRRFAVGPGDRRIRDLREPGLGEPAGRLPTASDLAHRRGGLPRSLGGARAARPERLATPRGVEPSARAERARRGGKSQRDGRREGSVYRRPLTPGSADRGRDRPGDGPRRGQPGDAPLRRPLPRHREDRRPRRDPDEAGVPHGRGVRRS